MYKKIFLAVPVVILIVVYFKPIFWHIRDYYYQLRFGAFAVDYQLGLKDRFLYQASIKALTPAHIRDKIDSNYFTLVGYNEWQRIPTVYPYTINAYIGRDAPTGSSQGVFLTNSKSVNYDQSSPEDTPGGMAYANDEYGDIIAENIIAFSYSRTYLIGKTRTAMTDNLPTPESITAYFILEFTTGKIDPFGSYEELMLSANRLGYKRHRFNLDYTKETIDTKEYKEQERKKYLDNNETELIPFQLFFDRFTGASIEL
ncbi:MAG: hypothetical protein ACKVOQ_04290 [Cyclobacteriaceae bacterium]